MFILVYFSIYLKFFIIKSQNERVFQLKRKNNRNKGGAGGGNPATLGMLVYRTNSYLVKVLDSSSPSGQQIWVYLTQTSSVPLQPCEALHGFSGTGTCRGCFFLSRALTLNSTALQGDSPQPQSHPLLTSHCNLSSWPNCLCSASISDKPPNDNLRSMETPCWTANSVLARTTFAFSVKNP